MRRFLTLAFLSITLSAISLGQAPPTSEQRAVRQADEVYRLAKLNNDVSALQKILADDFAETNQNGNTRNKAETLQLWKGFRVPDLFTDKIEITVSGNVAVAKGEMSEGDERMLFTRVYLKGSSGWQVLSSMQFRNPKLALARG